METKREKIDSPANDLPLDCWGNIVRFFGESRDLINLLQVVRGLDHYLKRLLPKCTNGIVFQLHEIPKVCQQQVTKLKCEFPTSKLDEIKKYMSNLGFEDVNDLVSTINDRFENLLCLWIKFRKNEYDISLAKHGDFCNFVFDRKTYFKNLKRLFLGVFHSNIQILEPFPCLEVLVITNRCGLDHDPFNENDGKTDLFVEWDLLPSLTILGLSDLRFNSFEKLRNRLKGISLNHCSSGDEEILDFHELQYITLVWGSVSQIKNISGASKLTRLKFLSHDYNDYVEAFQHEGYISEVEEFEERLLEIGNIRMGCDVSKLVLPSLKDLRLTGTRFSDLILPSGTKKFSISQFPLLELVYLRQVRNDDMDLEIEISNCPNLLELNVYCNKISVPFPERDMLKIEVLMVGTRDFVDVDRETNFPIDIIKYMKKLRVLNLCDVMSEVKSLELNSFLDLEEMVVLQNDNLRIISITSIVNCPKLEFVNFMNYEKGCEISQLPNVDSMVIDDVSITEQEDFDALFKMIGNLQKLKNLEIQSSVDDDLEVELDVNPGLLDKVERLVFYGFSRISFDGNCSTVVKKMELFDVEKCTIENHSELDIVSIDFKQKVDVQVKNCEKMEKFLVCSSDNSADDYMESSICLENLPNLKKCKIKGIGRKCKVKCFNIGSPMFKVETETKVMDGW